MIIKTKAELKNILKSGEICKKVLNEALKQVKPNVSTLKINNFIHKKITEYGAKPAFLGVNSGDGPYPYASCISINHQVVHTLPSEKAVIKKGDLVTIDMGVIYNGYNTDTAHTVEVETNNHTRFLNVGKKALKKAIEQAYFPNKVGNISYTMQKHIERGGFSVSRDLVGHGIGKKVHEPPQIPCYGKKGKGEQLKPNMLIAVEVMYMQGNWPIKLGKDGFSLDTADKSLSAQFEHTIIVNSNKKPTIVV